MFEDCARCHGNRSYGWPFCRACQKNIDTALAQLERADRETARQRRISERGDPWGRPAPPRRTPGATIAAVLLVLALICIALLVFT